MLFCFAEKFAHSLPWQLRKFVSARQLPSSFFDPLVASFPVFGLQGSCTEVVVERTGLIGQGNLEESLNGHYFVFGCVGTFTQDE
jgi:hypothetical protein